MSYLAYTKLSGRGQLVIPRSVREQVQLVAGQRLKISVSDDHKSVILEPVTSFTDQLFGSAKKIVPDDLLGYIKDLRSERDR